MKEELYYLSISAVIFSNTLCYCPVTEKCVIFSPKEFQKEQNDFVKV